MGGANIQNAVALPEPHKAQTNNTIIMVKKDYLEPSVEVIEMGYRDPVCQAMSGNIPGYEPLVPPGDEMFNLPSYDTL